MTARQRIMALRLLEKQKKNPELFKKMGVEITMKEKDAKKSYKRLTEKSIPATPRAVFFSVYTSIYLVSALRKEPAIISRAETRITAKAIILRTFPPVKNPVS